MVHYKADGPEILICERCGTEMYALFMSDDGETLICQHCKDAERQQTTDIVNREDMMDLQELVEYCERFEEMAPGAQELVRQLSHGRRGYSITLGLDDMVEAKTFLEDVRGSLGYPRSAEEALGLLEHRVAIALGHVIGGGDDAIH